ncbi:MAG TPA: tripartite tricarboxylate transporter substrate binding protein [Burkholderiales bacterium]|nr:tripartite tricarboxylate transporter substrate binding protein [Burkholderiales bacterium]
MSKYSALAGVGLALLAAAGTIEAQQKYPVRPIRLVVPFAPGGGTDIMARSIAQKLSQAFGQTVVVDNRAGGGGTIGTETVIRANPDGYTMIIVSGSYAANAAVYRLPYDSVNDIAAIALVGETGNVIALPLSVPIRSIKELIAYDRTSPGKLNYASTGTGGFTHLITELFNQMAGTQLMHIPYKGTGPALNDLLGGQIQVLFGSLPSTIPLIKQNRVRGIGVTTPRRSSAIPDIPAIGEVVPGYEAVLWYGFWGPKQLPKSIVTLWNTEIRKALKQPDMRARLANEGLDPADAPPERFLEVVRRDVAKWNGVVKKGNIKAGS